MDKINDYNKQYYQDILTKTYDRRYFEEVVKKNEKRKSTGNDQC